MPQGPAAESGGAMLDKQQKYELKKLQRETHENFVWISDEEKLGVLDKWEPVPSAYKVENDGFVGDCEEYARYMCVQLRELGHMPRLMSCYTETGDYHLVCEDGGWIADNRFREIRTVSKAKRMGYKLVNISTYVAGEDWQVIDNT